MMPGPNRVELRVLQYLDTLKFIICEVIHGNLCVECYAINKCNKHTWGRLRKASKLCGDFEK